MRDHLPLLEISETYTAVRFLRNGKSWHRAPFLKCAKCCVLLDEITVSV